MSWVIFIPPGIIHNYPTNVDVEKGFFLGLKNDYAYGRVLLSDAADVERTAWSFGDDGRVPLRGDTKVYPEVSGSFFMASSDAADTDLEFTISAIAANGDELTIVASTDGTDGRTPVNIGSGLDINFVFMSGADQENVGQIYFTNDGNFTLGIPDTAVSVLAHVPIGYGCSPQATVRVPNDKLLVVSDIVLTLSRSGGALGSAIIHCRARRPGGSWIVVREWHVQTGPIVLPANSLTFGATSIVEIRLFDVSDLDTSLGTEIHFSLIDV